MLLLVACLAGMEAVPYFFVWGLMQVDLLQLPERFGRVASAMPSARELAVDPPLQEYDEAAA